MPASGARDFAAVGKRAREEWKRKREQAVREGNRRKKKPLGSPRVAGPDMQHKILKFCREILNDALDRELVQKNVAKARFLSKNFKKSRPLIDPLMEEDAARFLHEVKALPLSPFKVACLALFSSGMRPRGSTRFEDGRRQRRRRPLRRESPGRSNTGRRKSLSIRSPIRRTARFLSTITPPAR